MIPEGHRLHLVPEGISRGFTAVNGHQQTAAAKGSCEYASLHG